MAEIDALSCDSGGANLGVGTCVRNPKKDKYIIFAPLDKVYTPTDILTAQATFQADAIADDPTERIYPLKIMVSELQGSDMETFTFPDGTTETTRDPILGIRYEHRLGACVQNQLITGFSGRQGQYGIFTVDAGNTLRGEHVYDDNGQVIGVKPMQLSKIYAPPYTPPTESEPVRMYVDIEWASYTSLNQDTAYIDLGFPFSEIEQLQTANVGLVAWVSGTAGTVTMSLLTGCGGQNMADLYPTAIVPASFIATNFATGNVITITAVTKTTTNGKGTLLVDFDQADPDYPAVGGKILLKGAAPSVLAGQGIEYFEIPSFTLTRPA